MPIFAVSESFGTLPEYRSRFDERTLRREFDSRPCEFQSLGGYDEVLKIKLQTDYLMELTREAAKKRWGDVFSNEVRRRLDYELDVIKHLGCAASILIMADCVAFVRDNGGIVGPCRGAASGSAVLYALGVTSVDPLKYGLLFERFLNPRRIMLPDIDIELDVASCSRVVEYIAAKYGPEHAALIPMDKADPRRGVVIAEVRLSEFMPLVNGDGTAPLKFTGYGSESVEAAGGVRFDFIGVDSLSELKRLKTTIEAKTGEPVALDRMPFDDWSRKTLDYTMRRTWHADLRNELEVRKNGSVAASVIHPLMNDVMAETHGLFIYAEQIISGLQRLGVFTPGEADCAYKGMKMKISERTAMYHRLFIEGCLANEEFRMGEFAEESVARSHAELVWMECVKRAPLVSCRANDVAHARIEDQIACLRSVFS